MVDGTRRKLYLFAFVLGYSRMLFARFTTSTKQHVLHGCLQHAFESVGIPAELLVDNMKQAVDAHTKEGVRFNRRFLDFCEHYGVTPFAAPPYWPRAKGKVERGVGYVKGSFLEGRCFTDLGDLNRQLDCWLDGTANVRIHGTTGERPCERWQWEQKELRAYERVPAYDTRPVEVRKVMRDSYICYGRVFYSVDPVAVGQTVVVKAAGERIGDPFEVYLGSQLVASHRLKPSRSPRVTDPEHEGKIRMPVGKTPCEAVGLSLSRFFRTKSCRYPCPRSRSGAWSCMSNFYQEELYEFSAELREGSGEPGAA